MRINRVTISIDGVSVKVQSNTTVLQACESVGIEIPRFCFHERLNIAGNCRICLVEIAKSPKPQASCALPVINGIHVFTNRPLVKKARERVLEMILKNHPLDCPICDQGGECDLQDEAWGFGRSWSRFTERKRAVDDKFLGPLIKTVMNRCIHCTRCVRFAREIAGVEFLGTTSRGETTEITTYVDRLFEREISGNVIDLCPVGALTSKPYAFTARPWELSSVKSIDLTDGLGRNTQLDVRGSDLLRIIPRLNEQINEEWLTDKGRFNHDGLLNQRLLFPLLKERGQVTQIGQNKAWHLIEQLLLKALSKQSSVGFFSGKLVDFERLNHIQNILDSLPNRFMSTLVSNKVDWLNNFGFNQSLNKLEQRDCCFLIGLNPRTEGSLINTRLRKRVLAGRISVYTFGPQINLTFKTTHLGSHLSSLIQFIEGKHAYSKEFINAKQPSVVFGDRFLESNSKELLSILEVLKHRTVSLNYLHSNANTVTQSIIGFDQVSKTNKAIELGFALEEDSLENPNVQNWIYLGSHVSEELLKHPNLRLCLPAARFVEKTSQYLNLNKINQQTNKAIERNLKSTDQWLQELCFLITHSKRKLNIVNYSDYLITRSELEQELCFSSKENHFIRRTFCDSLDEELRLFQSNIISKNSSTLASCARLKKWSNFE